tara:strand:+ start:215 stop:397 length:183 start_codon:yes stop_codon:yes gene_type:complete
MEGLVVEAVLQIVLEQEQEDQAILHPLQSLKEKTEEQELTMLLVSQLVEEEEELQLLVQV